MRRGKFEKVMFRTPTEPSYITRQALDQLLLELQRMEREDREIGRLIGEAANFGDLRENAEYDSIQQRAHLHRTKMYGLGNSLKACTVYDPESVDTSAIRIGSLISLENIMDAVMERYVLLDPLEIEHTDLWIFPGIVRLSYKSELGNALLARKMGETFTFRSAGGHESPYRVLHYMPITRYHG